MIPDPVLVNDWHPVAQSSDINSEKPLAVKLLGEEIVIWRVGDQIMAWKDLCIHRGARLSQGKVDPKQSTLACPYHGWVYAADGVCVSIPAHPEQTPPARARVIEYIAREQYGLVWVCIGKPAQEIPIFPEWDDPSFRKVLCGPYSLRAAGPRIIENFLDVAHFPFVHAGLLGSPLRPQIDDYEAIITNEGIIAQDVRIWQPDPDGSGQGSVSIYTYQAMRPLTAYFTKTSSGPRFAAYFPVTPIDSLESQAWLWLALNYRSEASDDDLRAFEDAIMAQDIPVVESQRPELLPLDLQTELHLRSDRTAIAYRKWLAQLGLTYGVS
jgi:phenylpropionate dioxygenase-like ring-hydroxylating dioxygenase large terminal subunit